jgi:hypothetical protein
MGFLTKISLNPVVRGTNTLIIYSGFMTLIYVAYLLWWPMEAVTFDHKILDIATSYVGSDCARNKEGLMIFHPGDIVPLKVSGTKHMDTPGLVMPRYVDSTVTLLPDYTAMRPVGRFEEVILTHKVPRGSGGGIHYFEFTMIYEVNPLRKLTYQTRSVPFWVEADPPKQGPKGDKGDKGDTGDRGAKGDPGRGAMNESFTKRN